MQIERNIVSIQPKQTRLIRAPFLSTTTNSEADEVAKQATQSRFVEPYDIGEEQGTAIAALLDELDISDAEGRHLFMLALEYEIGAYQQVVMEHMEPIEAVQPVDQGLLDLAMVARQLSDMLELLDEDAKTTILQGMAGADIFKRSSDQRYLRSLQCEIDRLACACDLGIEAGNVRQGPLNEASRKFINMLANIYYECFETQPGGGSDEPFSQILTHIVEQTGLKVRVDQNFLEETLLSHQGA